MSLGTLEFSVHKVDESTGDLKGAHGYHIVNFDPDSITHNRSVQAISSDNSDNTGTTTQLKGKGPDTLSFDLHLDCTGAIPGSRDVNSEVMALYAKLFDLQSAQHMCNVVRFNTNVGAIKLFEGTVESFNTTYSLFKPNGEPLRAKVSLSFKEYTKEKQNEQRAQMSSPDMSHANTIKAGDNIALKCDDVYNDIGHYVNVARYNGLVNFRNLEVGSNLYLPPLKN